MKSFYQKLSIVTTVLFIGSILYNIYLMYNLPNVLIKANLISMLDLYKIQPILANVNLFLGAGTILGLITIILLIVADKRSTTENIVYVESFKKKKEENNSETENAIDSEDSDQKLHEVQKIIQNSKNSSLECCNKTLSYICKALEASTAALYLSKKNQNKKFIELYASYAYIIPESKSITFEFGEGLAGQVAKLGKMVNLKSIPEGYIKIFSGLGDASPTNLIILPIINSETLLGVAEIASFKEFSKKDEVFLQETFNYLAEHLANPQDKEVKVHSEQV